MCWSANRDSARSVPYSRATLSREIADILYPGPWSARNFRASPMDDAYFAHTISPWSKPNFRRKHSTRRGIQKYAANSAFAGHADGPSSPASLCWGRITVNRVLPASEVTDNEPPWSVTMRCAIANPRPVPCSLVV